MKFVFVPRLSLTTRRRRPLLTYLHRCKSSRNEEWTGDKYLGIRGSPIHTRALRGNGDQRKITFTTYCMVSLFPLISIPDTIVTVITSFDCFVIYWLTWNWRPFAEICFRLNEYFVKEYVTDVPTASFNMNNIDFMFTHIPMYNACVFILAFHTSSEGVLLIVQSWICVDCQLPVDNFESLRRGSRR